jgi:hypothetical protein
MSSRLLAAVGSLLLVSPAWAGTIVNGGFENGLDDWTISSATLVTAPTIADKLKETGVWNPVEGNRFAYLLAGGTDAFTTLETTFTVAADNTRLKFNVFFDAGEDRASNPVYDDRGEVLLVDETGDINAAEVFFRRDASQVGTIGSFGWTEIDRAIEFAGTYTLLFRVKNTGDDLQPSALGVDNVRLDDGTVPAVVPLPSAIWGGAIVLGVIATRRLLTSR